MARKRTRNPPGTGDGSGLLPDAEPVTVVEPVVPAPSSAHESAPDEDQLASQDAQSLEPAAGPDATATETDASGEATTADESGAPVVAEHSDFVPIGDMPVDDAVSAQRSDPSVEDLGEDARPGLARTAPRSVSELHLKGIIESLVFVSDRPLGAGDVARIARADVRDVRRLLHELRDEYRGRGVQLDEIAGGWQFRSSAGNAPFVRELLQARPVRLTRAQIETLAIIAYRQPITRPEVDDIRGVDSGSALKVLLERDLIRSLGRKEDVGRPVLYGTTGQFLEFFGLKSLREMPTLREFTDLSADSEATLVRELGNDDPVTAVTPDVPNAEAADPSQAEGPDPGEPETTDAHTEPAHDDIADFPIADTELAEQGEPDPPPAASDVADEPMIPAAELAEQPIVDPEAHTGDTADLADHSTHADEDEPAAVDPEPTDPTKPDT